MRALYNQSAPRKSANLSINSDLLHKAKQLKINLSATLERALIKAVKETQKAKWLEENKEAIKGYNKRVEEDGLFGDSLRSF